MDDCLSFPLHRSIKFRTVFSYAAVKYFNTLPSSIKFSSSLSSSRAAMANCITFNVCCFQFLLFNLNWTTSPFCLLFRFFLFFSYHMYASCVFVYFSCEYDIMLTACKWIYFNIIIIKLVHTKCRIFVNWKYYYHCFGYISFNIILYTI